MSRRGKVSDSQSPLPGVRGGLARIRQAAFDLRFEIAVISLLVLTVAAISFAGLILRNNLVIRPGGEIAFTNAWHADDSVGGNSEMRVDPARPLQWSCELRTVYQYPYCSYEIVLERKPGQGIDLNSFQTIEITLDYHGPADSVRVDLKNFDRRYSHPGNRETAKYNQVELPLHNGRQTIEARLADFKVADWWIQKNHVPYRLSHTQFDNIISIEMASGNNSPPGRQDYRVHSIVLRGSIVPVEQWYLGILGCWIVLICVFLIYRILGLQQDLRRRRLLEQVAKGEAQLARESARRDHLTGLYNRRGVTERYQQMLAEGAEKPVAIMLVDIDHFKAINDHFGHALGDEVLAAFAALLRANTRDADLIARWGGEEFLLIARIGDAQAATDLANKLRLLIAATDFPHGSLTASFGVYYCDRLPEKVRPAISNADRALYAAKEEGRDRVVLYEPPSDSAPKSA